jgi:hypothetical protein
VAIPAAQTDTSFDATLAGAVDGTNAIFTLRSTPLADYPVRGYRNGVRLTTGADYTVSGATVTMLAPQLPAAGDSLVFDYFVSAIVVAPVGVGDLTTLANVKAMANVTSTDDDALLQRLISAESSRFQTLIDRALGTATYTETRDGAGGPVAGVSSGVGIYGYAPPTSRGSTRLLLKNYPVQSVTSVTIDGVPVPPSPAPARPAGTWSTTSSSSSATASRRASRTSSSSTPRDSMPRRPRSSRPSSTWWCGSTRPATASPRSASQCRARSSPSPRSPGRSRRSR